MLKDENVNEEELLCLPYLIYCAKYRKNTCGAPNLTKKCEPPSYCEAKGFNRDFSSLHGIM
jgi:hypothetical protein